MASGWRSRFDRMVLLRAREELKIARFVARSGFGDPLRLEEEARRRLARMIPDARKAALCDFVLVNEGTLEELRGRVGAVWGELTKLA